MSTRSKKQYTREYKREVLELLRTSGKSKAQGLSEKSQLRRTTYYI